MIPLVTRDKLREMLDTRQAVLVDALPAAYYEREHLPGALNLVGADVVELAPQLLPDQEALIVTYCSNTACSNSEAVARALRALGYRNVHKYAEGIQDWVEAGLPTESGVLA